MMEGSHEDGNYLVRVRAQVMTRDDSTGGWVPMGAGGLSYVSVCKGSVSGEDDKVEYLIFGKRLADQSVVLSCTIKKDFQYNKVMPTFHHWRTGDKKFGLTFQTAADARAFDKGVRMAIEDLSDGIGDFPNFHDSDIGEDDVFMTLELPIDSHSSSGSSSFSGGSFRHPLQNLDPAASPYTHPHANHHHLHRMNFIRSSRFPAGINPSSNNNIGGYVPDPTQRSRHDDAWTKDSSRIPRKDYLVDFDKIEMTGDLNSYVQLSRDKGCRTEHDYSYPVVDSFGKSGSQDTLGSLKKTQNFDMFNCQMAPRLPVKAKKKDGRWRKDTRKSLTVARAQCRHCLEMYSPEDNHPGSCEYGPDAVLKCINKASCIKCAQCMLYHCMSDSEGDFSQHPCSCDMSDGHCPKRWTALAVLSIFVPCLWCYLPFRACHRCGIRCGMCGGKHDPA